MKDIQTTKIAIFKGRKIRKTIYNNEGGFQLSTICRQLKLEASDGKKYETDCANVETILFWERFVLRKTAVKTAWNNFYPVLTGVYA